MGSQTPKSKSDRSGGVGEGSGRGPDPKMCVPLNITPIKVNVDSPQHPFERLPPGRRVGRAKPGSGGPGRVGRGGRRSGGPKNWKKIKQNDPKKTQKMG
jgi:hypothetical protein